MRETFIKLLQSQPSQNFGNTNTKINIHIPIRGEMLNYCMDINQKIQKITSSGVSFNPDSFQIPHITLYMGFVKNQNDYIQIMKRVYEISRELKIFEITPLKAYLKGPKKNYVFIDTEQAESIIELKKKFKKELGEYMEPLTWDVVSSTPHITIGYIKQDFSLVEELLIDYPLGYSFYADAVEVSYGGPWGSCIGSIRTFEFPV